MRKNTNFPLQLLEQFKKDLVDIEPEYAFLKYYQNVVRKYFLNGNLDSRGLLINHEMGLGKSILAIAIAVDMLKEYPCILLLTKSLQDNMYGNIIKYIKLRKEAEKDLPEDKKWPITRLLNNDDKQESLNDWIKHNFNFVSMNAGNMLKQLNKASYSADEFDIALEKKFGEITSIGNLDGKLLIVDEAHNLFRAITNGSKNAIGVYDLVMRSRNLKILFLTGTPIANDPFELVPCFNMLGSSVPNVITLPEEYQEFYKLYVDNNKSIKNREKFQNRIFGLVSYVNHTSTPGKAILQDLTPLINVEFPTLLPIQVEKVEMTTNQYMKYKIVRDKEMQEGGKKFTGNRIISHPPLIKPKLGLSSTYRVRSRQISNYCPPSNFTMQEDDSSIAINKDSKILLQEIRTEDLESPKFKKIVSNIRASQLNVVYSQFVGMGGLGTFSRYLDSLGWKRFKTFNGGDEYDGGGAALPSVDEYLKNIENEYNKRKLYAGADESVSEIGNEHIIIDVDDSTDLKNDNDSTDLKNDNISIQDSIEHQTYAIISGDITIDDRNKIAEVYNSKENAHGELISLLLISATGAEGLDLKGVRQIHIMEPYWNWGRISQVISRGVRNDSHKHLLPDEKNVTVYIYLAVGPGDLNDRKEVTTDVELYEDSIANQVGINSFINAINETSIECALNEDKNCRMCNPNNKLLFTDDPARDIRTSDPCEQIKEVTLKATPITVNNVEYYYIPDEKSIYDYKIFIYDKSIDGYREINSSHDAFISVISAIESSP
jgi:hypothetical protein